MNKSDRINKYRELCKLENLPFYLQAWWWDAAEGENNWDVVLSFDKEQQIVGAFPFIYDKGKIFKQIRQCKHTTYQDIYLKYPDNVEIKDLTKNSIQKRVYADIISQLPDFHFFDVSFHPNFKNWLPFYWKGFKQTTRYTHILDSVDDTEKLFEEFKTSLRRDIRKAKKTEFTIIKDAASKDFLSNLKNSYDKKNINYSIEGFEKLDKKLEEKNLRSIWLAEKDGNIASGLYMVKDITGIHCLFSFQNPKIKTRTPLNQLIWEAIKHHATADKYFDFEGSMIPEIEYVLRSFGTSLTPYMRIYKAKNKFLHSLAVLKDKFP